MTSSTPSSKTAGPVAASSGVRSSTPPPPSFLSSLDRRTHELYIRSRALAHLQRSYKHLLTLDPDEIEASRRTAEQNRSAGASKRRRTDSSTTNINDPDNPHPPPPVTAAAVSSSSSAVVGPGGGVPPLPSAAGATTSTTEPTSSANIPLGPAAAKLPRIDSTYRLDLVAARPEAGVAVLGDPPSDMYALPGAGPNKRPDNKAVIAALVDRSTVPMPFVTSTSSSSVQTARAIQSNGDGIGNDNGNSTSISGPPKLEIHKDDTSMLFYDLDSLTDAQVRAVAEFEWSRQLPFPGVNNGNSAAGAADGTSSSKDQHRGRAASRSSKKALREAQLEEDAEVELEMETIRRAFCDKTRANALAWRANASASAGVGW